MLVACVLPLLAVQPAQATPAGCQAGTKSDFNGDGYSDAVVADPYAKVDGQAEAGRVIVLYGDSDGRIGEGGRGEVAQGLNKVNGTAEAGDRFGFALASADINCDGSTDLVVGTPYEDISGFADTGMVQIVWGGPIGLGDWSLSREYYQGTFSQPQKGLDLFGYAVDALDYVELPGTGAPNAYELAIGVPGGDLGSDFDAGWVGTVSPSSGPPQLDVLTEDTTGIPDQAEPGDRFGSSVSLGYFLGDAPTADVAVGAPNEDVGDASDCGTVTIARDFPVGSGGVVYDQNSPGVPDVVESGDRFGYSLDSMRAGSTTRLAVGVPYEDVGSAANAGLVQGFSGNGATLTPGAGLTQNTAGVFDESETGDLFGNRVAWARPGLGDPGSWLAVSAPLEDGVANNTGLVQLFPMSNLAAERNFSESSPGIPGNAQAGERFGSSLAVVSGAQERALLIGAPDDVENSTGLVDVIPFGGGSARYWRPGVDGVPSAGANRFGYSLATSG
jgi:hypothetical protein